MHEYQLRELMEAEPTLSRIVITKDFRIILPDYNDTEIVMTPLPKAVFMLFLRHPEGIPFKLMRNYRDELLYLYKQVTRSLFDRKIKQSIDGDPEPVPSYEETLSLLDQIRQVINSGGVTTGKATNVIQGIIADAIAADIEQ